MAKIHRNQERDRKVQQQLADMGWHSITVWECELKPKRREATLRLLERTLNRLWMDDHGVKTLYEPWEEERQMAAESAAELLNDK